MIDTESKPAVTSMKLIPGLDMPPTARTIWVSPKAKEVWEPKIQAAASAYYRLEKATVKAGIRACTTHHADPERLNDDLGALAREGFMFLPRLRVGAYSGFAHSHPPVESGKRWNWYGPIATSPAAARAFVEAEVRGDHDTVGKLLGYPECCREFFRTVWMAKYVDPIWQAAERTSPGWIVNINDMNCVDNSELRRAEPKPGKPNLIELEGPDSALTWSGSRYIGLRLAAHIPCSLSCEATIKQSKRWLQLGRDLRIPGIEDLVNLLNMPTEWNALHGIAEIRTPIFKIVTNTVACDPAFVVRKHGDFVPTESATGLKFPFLAQKPA